MAKLEEVYLGHLDAATDLDKKSYEGWREEYIQRYGVICVYISEKKAKGKYMLRFFTTDQPDLIDEDGSCLRTSPGDLFIDNVEKKLSLKTDHSIYSFSKISRIG
ncbi:MAG: hypothetical protein IJU50_01815 [Lachnospiraceae bacterium]|nr:hypothetical protein [Lachnospiraceae bacterium]